MIWGILGPPLGNAPVCVTVDDGVDSGVLLVREQDNGHFFFIWFKIFLQQMSLDSIIQSISGIFLFLGNDLPLRSFFTIIRTIF